MVEVTATAGLYIIIFDIRLSFFTRYVSYIIIKCSIVMKTAS